jgi:transposase-like protein
MHSPPFCPNPKCSNHKHPPLRRWFWKSGCYHTRTFGIIQRFICLSCAHRFSSQSFSINYYAKKKINYHLIDKQLRSTGSIRDISRDLSCSTTTVLNRISRLARNALAAHNQLSATLPYAENLVADGFESFCVSQYFPNNITLLAGKTSQYLYFANYCTLRRKGRMTKKQKQHRELLEKQWKADPKGVKTAFDEVVSTIPATFGTQTLYTDEKHEYVRSLHNRTDISHVRINSKEPRTIRNQLFSVNYLDREIRKDCANHVRETVCFARDVNNCMERLWVYFVYHNYRKRYRIQPRERRTHAEVAGIDAGMVRKVLRGYYTRRSFLSLTDVTGTMRSLWCRNLETPLKGAPAYVPRYVAA